jgi:flavin-dependent dehydrogenase
MLLARQGYEVALLDQATFPRAKACGEFINPAACDLIEEVFGFSRVDLQGAGGEAVASIRLQLKRSSVEIPMVDGAGTPICGVSMPRVALDSMLVDQCRAAGVQVYEEHRVRRSGNNAAGVEVFGESKTGPFEFKSRVFIAADGTYSVLARNRGLTRAEPRLQSIGVVAHLRDLSETQSERPGVWMFPSTGDGTMFGFTRQSQSTGVLSGSVPKGFARELASDSGRFLQNWISRYPELVAELGPDATITNLRTTACFAHSLKRCVSERTLFLGDAARFVDPFTGEGIHHAVESGRLAARVITDALSNNTKLEWRLSQYERDRRELSRRYSLCRIVQSICNRPWLINVVGERLRRKPALAKTLIGALVDVLPTRSVFDPRFLIKAISP